MPGSTGSHKVSTKNEEDERNSPIRDKILHGPDQILHDFAAVYTPVLCARDNDDNDWVHG